MKRLPDNAVVDPYAPPELPRPAPPGVRSPRKPSVLTAIGVLMIVLGVLYSVTWAFGVITLIAGPKVFRSSGPANNPVIDQAQTNYEQALDAIHAKYAAAQVATTMLQTPVMLAVFAGGVLLLRQPLRFRAFIWCACLAALIFEIGYVIPLALIQIEHLGAANEYLNELTGAGDRGSTIAWIGRISMASAAVVFLTLFLARIIFFGWAMITLGRPESRRWFLDDGGDVVAARIVK